jgi:hypothetical protein
LFTIALAPMLSACGGGNGSCGKVQPCGGSVVGNWTISGECFNSASLNMDVMADCPGATVNTSGVKVSGSATFDANGNYTVMETVSLSATETIPASCLSMNGLTLTCAQLDQLIKQSVASDPTVFQSASCSGNSSCTCRFTLAPQTMNESGTYTTSGTSLMLSGSSSAAQYCAQGNELHLMTLNMTMPMGSMGQANIDTDLVLTKK